MRRRARELIALAAGVGVIGCTRFGNRAAFTLTDSAGVAVALNASGEAPSWSLSPTPSVVLGDVDAGGTPLFRVYGARLGSDGRIVIGHAGANEVRTYAPDGRLLWVAGRAGDGPGEFRHVTEVTVLPGDSVAVLDLRLRRVTLLDPEGGLVGVTTLAVPPLGELPRNSVYVPSPGLLGVTPRHRIFALLHMMLLTEGRPGIRHFRGALFVFDAEGRPGDSLLSVPVSRIRERPDRDPEVEDIPFSPTLRPYVEGDLLYLAPGDSWRVDVYDTSGRQLRSVREVRPRVAVTPEMVAALPDPPRGSAVERGDPADSLPAIGDIVADDEGRIWAVAYRADDAAPTSARVYSAEGRLTAVVALPGGFQLMDVRGRRLVGVHKDSLDVETVEVYGLSGATR